MKKLLIDTNIIIDLLAKRKDFYQETQQLFTLADEKKISLYASSLTFANIHYVISKELSDDETRKVLMKLKLIVKILPLDEKTIELALSSDFKVFEDGVQYYTALENKLDIIITRNKKDFKTSKLPILTAKEYLNR